MRHAFIITTTILICICFVLYWQLAKEKSITYDCIIRATQAELNAGYTQAGMSYCVNVLSLINQVLDAQTSACERLAKKLGVIIELKKVH